MYLLNPFKFLFEQFLLFSYHSFVTMTLILETSLNYYGEKSKYYGDAVQKTLLVIS